MVGINEDTSTLLVICPTFGQKYPMVASGNQPA